MIEVGQDAAGNQTHDDAGHSYTYDAEGKVVQVDGGATATYVYDALNQRVQVTTGSGTSEFVYDTAGRRVSGWLVGSAYGPAGFGNQGRIYWDGGLLANRAQDGTTYFHHGDWLGTGRRRTDFQGNAADTQVSAASGELFSQNGSFSAAQDNAQFTGQEYDAETGTDHFQFRQYQPTQGRWMSPDPYDGSYDYSNPQSFNRYAYVLNDPLSSTDPLGLRRAPCSGSPDDCDNGGGGMAILTGWGYSFGATWNEFDFFNKPVYGDVQYGRTPIGMGTIYNDSNTVGTGTAWYPSWGLPLIGTGLDLLLSGVFSNSAVQNASIDPDTARITAFVKAVAEKTAGFPEICSGGGFVYAGRQGTVGGAHAFAGYLGTYDSKEGWSNNGLLEGAGEHGGLAVGGSLKTGLEGIGFLPVFAGGYGEAGVLGAASGAGISLGFYAGTPDKFPYGIGGGGYVNISSMGACYAGGRR